MKHQNKVFRTIMALAATAILAASCAKEVMTKDEFFEGLYEKCTIEADATLPGSGDADSTANTDKAYLDGSGKVIWQNGDQLNINGTRLTVATIDSGDMRAKFYGTVNGIVQGSYLHFWAAYPATTNFAASFTDPNSLSFTLPATQTIDPSNLNQSLKGYTYMVGYTRVPQGFHRLHFQMRNMGSVLKLTLKANANDFRKIVDKIEFTSNANLAGTFTVNNNSSSPTISQGSGSSTTLVVNFTGGGLDISSQKTIYVFLPPLSGKSLNMKIYGGYGLVSYVEVNKTSASLERNKIYSYENKNITFDYVFSVGSNTKVIFSPGNLQWSRSNGTATNTTHNTAASSDEKYNYGIWRFAENQWNFVGSPSWNGTTTPKGNVYGYNGTNTQCDNVNIAEGYKGWIDLFGWGTSGWKSSFPWLRGIDNTKYGPASGNIAGTNYDWGKYNAIYNPKTNTTYPANTWRTLTKDEWNYLLFSRSGNRYAKATVNNVQGLIILPDGWNTNTYTLSQINKPKVNFNVNVLNAAQWTTLEKNGCVFLPACGYRWLNTDYYSDVRRVVPATTVYIWTATAVDNKRAYHLQCDYQTTKTGADDGHVTLSEGNQNDGRGRAEGLAVRLVRNHN